MHVWQVDIPHMALSHPFLMHGLLAISALHLSTVQPDRRLELARRAAISEHLALPSFRDFVSHGNAENIHAVFAFAGFVVPYVVSGTSFTPGGAIPCLDDDKAHWFFAFRGQLHMLVRSWEELARGPFSPLLVRRRPATDYSDNPEDIHLAKLHGLMQPDHCSSEKEIETWAVCGIALDELRRVFVLPQSPSRSKTMIAIHVWPGTVSERFVQLIHQRQPEALVVLAHYCVLLKRVDSCWWLKGVGTRLLEAIDEELVSNWRQWIQWALDQPVS